MKKLVFFSSYFTDISSWKLKGQIIYCIFQFKYFFYKMLQQKKT
jgi:hypothetical protein